MSKNDYTKEELFEIARNYTSRKDFRENCPKEYTCADKLDILRQCYWFDEVREKYTFEQCQDIFNRYNSIESFASGAFIVYGVCTINGWIDKFERYKTVTKNKKVKNYSKRLISPFIDKLQSETLEMALEDNFFKKYESLDIEELFNKLLSYGEINEFVFDDKWRMLISKYKFNDYKSCNIYYINDDFYFIKKEVIYKARLRLFEKEDFIVEHFQKYPIINTLDNCDIDKLNYDYEWYKFMTFCQVLDFFIVGKNEYINYENTENLEHIQKQLIEQFEERYFKKQRIYPSMRDLEGYVSDSMISYGWWIFRGWSEEYAKKRVSELQSQRSNVAKRKRKENPEKYKACFLTSIKYYLSKGYSEEESAQMLHDRQNTTSLESFIKRYGEEEGTIRFNDRNSKWQNTLQNKENYAEIIEKRSNPKSISNVSQELFDSVRERLLNNDCDVQMFYGRLNHEYGLGVKGWGGFLYDFVIPELKYAVEFNGERFHPDPRLYPTEESHKLWVNPYGKTYEEILEKDTVKNQAIRDKGFELDIVWEREYRSNKLEIVTQIVDKILKIYEEHKLTNNSKV